MGCGIEPRKIRHCRGREFSFARRQHVRHYDAGCWSAEIRYPAMRFWPVRDRMHFRRWKRRQVIRLLGKAAIFPSLVRRLAARGEAKPKMLRVGYVGVQSPDAPLYKAFRNRMAELGYQEGRNFSFEYLQTPDIEGYGPAYRELAAREVDVFFAVGEPGLRAAQAAAGALPIALLAVDFDPMAKGYVASLARPGGNVTGIVVQQME